MAGSWTLIVEPEWAITRVPNRVGSSQPEITIGASGLLLTGRT